MTVASVVATIGLAIAALAGIPALVENRSIGDVSVVVGLSIAAGGIVLALLSIPGQVRAVRQIGADRRAAIEYAKAAMRLAAVEKSTVVAQLSNASRLTVRGLTDGTQAEIARLQLENVRVDASYQRAVIELGRHGLTVDEVLEAPPASASSA